MNEGATTWALVVGIDEYDKQDLRRLQGAAADALEAVGWLRKLGVPDEQIFLHVSPTKATRKRLEQLGMPYADATQPAIVSSIAKLRKTKGGSRLFVFLSGHGLYEPAGGRLFLTQEFGIDDQWVNLGIDAYCDLFLATGFRRQFLIMDGCLNFPYATNTRTQIEAEGLHGTAEITPNEANALVACFSAAQDQQATELEGRGAFMHRLLKALDPDSPWPDAVDLDFPSGIRTVNVEKLVRNYVGPVVERTVYDEAKLLQTPRVELLGAAQGGQIPPIYRLPDVDTSKVDVTIEPAQAVPSVQTIWLSVQRRPFWGLSLPKPPADAIEVPVVSRLPKGLRARVVCQVDSTAGWGPVESQFDFSTDQDQICPFKLSPLGVAEPAEPLTTGAAGLPQEAEGFPGARSRDEEPSAPSATETLGVHTVSRNGDIVPEADPLYRQVAQSLGMKEPPAWGGAELATGVTIVRHETGPEFLVEEDARAQAGQLVREWAEAVRKAAPPELGLLTVVRGPRLDEPPNLRLVLPAGGAAALAGFLADHKALWVGRPDQYGGREYAGWWLSLRQLESSPALRVDPGPVQVDIQLPWGSWTQTELAPTLGELTIELPASIGTPPLRVALLPELGHPLGIRGAEVVGLGSERPTGYLRLGLFGEEKLALQSTPLPKPAAWGLAADPGVLLSGSQQTPGQLLVVLDEPSRVRFPLHPTRPLAADLTRGTIRVEPVSSVAQPEWDLLVTTGQVDGLALEAARTLAAQKWEDELLGLAGAYALWAARDWESIEMVIANLGDLPNVGPDLDLLALAAGRHADSPPADMASDHLDGRIRRGEVPLFRWGVALALDLFGEANTSSHRRWRTALERIYRTLSPISVWTAWTE